jgi:hypothetical protein
MRTRTLAGNIAVVCFITAQFIDWIATYQGVTIFGTDVEGNPVLRFLMERYDIILSLTGAKLTATAAGAALHLFNRHFEVAFLTLVYAFFALLPWIRVLSFQPGF